jgi:protein-arginine kinase activator protein McsA
MSKIGIYVNGQLIGSCESCNIEDYEMTNDPEDIKEFLEAAIYLEDYERAAKIRDYAKAKGYDIQ